jgi:hypothetical protein
MTIHLLGCPYIYSYIYLGKNAPQGRDEHTI